MPSKEEVITTIITSIDSDDKVIGTEEHKVVIMDGTKQLSSSKKSMADLKFDTTLANQHSTPCTNRTTACDGADETAAITTTYTPMEKSSSDSRTNNCDDELEDVVDLSIVTSSSSLSSSSSSSSLSLTASSAKQSKVKSTNSTKKRKRSKATTATTAPSPNMTPSKTSSTSTSTPTPIPATKSKKTGKDKNTATQTPSSTSKKKNKVQSKGRLTNQPSIGSFFTKMASPNKVKRSNPSSNVTANNVTTNTATTATTTTTSKSTAPGSTSSTATKEKGANGKKAAKEKTGSSSSLSSPNLVSTPDQVIQGKSSSLTTKSQRKTTKAKTTTRTKSPTPTKSISKQRSRTPTSKTSTLSKSKSKSKSKATASTAPSTISKSKSITPTPKNSTPSKPEATATTTPSTSTPKKKASKSLSSDSYTSPPPRPSRTAPCFSASKQVVDDDIMAIVLGTHEDIVDVDVSSVVLDDKSKSSCGSSSTSTSRRTVHLPDLITQGLSSCSNNGVVSHGHSKSRVKTNAQKSAMKKQSDAVIPSSSSTTPISSLSSPKSSTHGAKPKKDPNKPKQPKTAFLYFSQEKRALIKSQNPELKFAEVGKEIGRLYRDALSLPLDGDGSMGKYVKLANEDKIRFQMEMQVYNNNNMTNYAQKNGNNSNTSKKLPQSHSQSGLETNDEGKTVIPLKACLQQNKSHTDPANDVEYNRNNTCGEDSAETHENNSTNLTEASNGSEPIIIEIDSSETTSNGKVDSESEGDVAEKGNETLNSSKEEVTIALEEPLTKSPEHLEKECSEDEEDDDDDDVTLGSDDDDQSIDENEKKDIEEKHEGDEASISVEEEEQDSPSGDLNDIIDMEIDGEPESNLQLPDNSDQEKSTVIVAMEEDEKTVVNVLKPRKKSIPVVIHTLQPRKKVRVNELQPRKKTKVNELQPRKKVNATSPVPNAQHQSMEESQSPAKTNLEAPAVITTKVNELKVHKKVNNKKPQQQILVNELQPRKKEKSTGVNQLKPRKKTAGNQLKPKSHKEDSTPATTKPIANDLNLKVKPNKLPSKESLAPLTEEEKHNLEKYQTMKSTYLNRARELVNRATNGSIEEEDFQSSHIVDSSGSITNPMEKLDGTVITEFKDDWVQELALLVQGSSLPLQELANSAARTISSGLEPNTKISVDAVTAKIKLVAARTQYLTSVPTLHNPSSNGTKVDIFTDTSILNMWRWELTSIDLLPDDKKASVKKARASRKKLKYHQKTILKLAQSIDDYEALVNSTTKNAENKQLRTIKISADEEKVLKYEREEEKARLLHEAKIQKEKEKKQKLVEREAEKDRKKEEAIKKQVEKARLEAEKDRKKEEVTKKQKSRMLSFFKSNSTKAKPYLSNISISKKQVNRSPQDSLNPSLDSDVFWKKLDCGDASPKILENLSLNAIKSKQRKTRKVNVRVFATVLPDNPFEQQPYDEERVISVWNRNKYLSFHEDYRPPYHGTWSKPRSSIVTGTNQFRKDSTYLNYEIDSEGEWEENDNEQGDDCSVGDKDEEELDDDEDTTKYNFQDGWMTQDGDLVLEDDDEETMAMRKKKNEGSENSDAGSTRNQKAISACIIAPLMGGLPQMDDEIECPQLVPDLIEGIESDEAHELLSSHESRLLISSSFALCLDPFPPLKKSEKTKPESKSAHDNATKKSSQEMSDEDMKTFAKFIHKCTLKSKELIIEELRLTHSEIIPSRAQANRKIDLIASKRRLKKGGGVVWEVKNNVLESLGLHHLIEKSEPTSSKVEDADEKKKKVTKSGDSEEKKMKGVKNTTIVKEPQVKKKTTKESQSQQVKKKKTKESQLVINRKKKTKESLVKKKTNASAKESPALVSPQEKFPSKKRKQPEVSKASANLLSLFLKKKKTC